MEWTETPGTRRGDPPGQRYRRFGEGRFRERSEAPTAALDPDSRRLQAVGRLAAGVAHDFNNLLSVILACSQELEEEIPDAELRERATEIRAAAQRGAKLTRQLLTHARREDGERQPVDVNAAILDATQLLVRTIGGEIELRTLPAAGLPRVMLGPGQLEQILINLAANSRDAMPRGGTVTISTELASVDGRDPTLGCGWHLRLSVSDDGEGMDPERVARAGEDFFTTKAETGTGLGLASVFEIARSAAGDVRIESAPGIGTTVCVYIPAVRDDGTPLATMPAVRTGTRPGPEPGL